jgi:uncharacterized protein
MKKPGIIFLIAVVFWIGTVIITFHDNKEIEETNLPDHSEYFFVEDYSHVLNENTEKYIYDVACRLEEDTNAQVVVVTVPNTQESELEDFSIDLANKWGIGDANLDNGILLLFETDETYPHVRLEVGAGLEGAIPDGKAGRILDDYAVGPKEAGLWNKGAGNTFIAVVKEIYAEYGKEPSYSLEFSENWGDGEAETVGTFADMEFPEAIVRINEKPFGTQVKDAIVDGTLLFFGILFIIGMIAAFILAIVSVFTGGGGGGSFIGRSYGGGRSSGGGFSGHSGGGGSFRGGGASR